MKNIPREKAKLLIGWILVSFVYLARNSKMDWAKAFKKLSVINLLDDEILLFYASSYRARIQAGERTKELYDLIMNFPTVDDLENEPDKAEKE
jgi:hypothetical protein